MTNLKRKQVTVIQINVKCPSPCGCHFSVLSCGVKARVLAFCPWCGRFRFVPAVGRRVPWSPGAPPSPCVVLPSRQLSLFDET